MTTDRLEFKAAFTTDDTGRISGTAWGFNSADRVGDVIDTQRRRRNKLVETYTAIAVP